jgi:hypothetical protein
VDGTDDHVLANMQINGQPRKLMIQSNKRNTGGMPLRALPFLGRSSVA